MKPLFYYFPLFFGLLLSVFFINPVNSRADIFVKVGKNGTVYFSNVPVSSDYKLYMVTERPVQKFNNRKVPYKKIIIGASDKYNVSAKLIEAVINVESGFNKNAVSDKGAEGLMQIMPETQKDLNISSPFNPSDNIYGGTKYLKSLLVKYGGNLSSALAAYNAGSEAVDRYGGIPPYMETQNYVKDVLHYYYKSKRENGKNK